MGSSSRTRVGGGISLMNSQGRIKSNSPSSSFEQRNLPNTTTTKTTTTTKNEEEKEQGLKDLIKSKYSLITNKSQDEMEKERLGGGGTRAVHQIQMITLARREREAKANEERLRRMVEQERRAYKQQQQQVIKLWMTDPRSKELPSNINKLTSTIFAWLMHDSSSSSGEEDNPATTIVSSCNHNFPLPSKTKLRPYISIYNRFMSKVVIHGDSARLETYDKDSQPTKLLHRLIGKDGSLFDMIKDNDDVYNTTLPNMMISIATKALLEDCIEFARHNAVAHVTWECLVKLKNVQQHQIDGPRSMRQKRREQIIMRNVAKKFRDIYDDDDITNRSLVRYLANQSKPSQCTCLEELYKESALNQQSTTVKTAKCHNCRMVLQPHGESSNSIVKSCARCNVFHYCHRQCQVDHWPTHKYLCKEISCVTVSTKAKTKAKKEDKEQ